MGGRFSVPLAVFSGGAIGSLVRWGILTMLDGVGGSLYVGLLVVNTLGACALGWLLGRKQRSDSISPGVLAFAATGLIGSFTTFSSYAAGGVELWTDMHRLGAGAFLLGSVALGWAAVIVGRKVAER